MLPRPWFGKRNAGNQEQRLQLATDYSYPDCRTGMSKRILGRLIGITADQEDRKKAIQRLNKAEMAEPR